MFQFFTVPIWMRWFYPGVNWEVEVDRKVLYLTFDDGPTEELTRYILETLNEYHAKATFFCVGNNLIKFPSLKNQIENNGHLLCNHTFHHQNGWKSNVKNYLDEVQKTDSLLSNKLFRPPYGKLKNQQRKQLLAQGFKIVMWSFLTYDFQKDLNNEKVKSKILQKCRGGSILTFHDNIKAENNLRILLPFVLKTFKDLGFSFEILAQELLK